jgi:hypothetical protein
MPSRVEMMESEQRKRRQEKFRKRSKSLFHKVEELATETDAWVVFIVRDRTGRVRSIRSSSNPNWNPSVNDLIVGEGFSNFMIFCAD